jgi:hypothetical protein
MTHLSELTVRRMFVITLAWKEHQKMVTFFEQWPATLQDLKLNNDFTMVLLES